MGIRRPLEPEYAAARGLSPAERARAMARAKQSAFHLANAVRCRDAAMVQRISDGLSQDEVWALAITLAEVADLLRLKYVKDLPDDGMPQEAVRLVPVA